MSAFAAVFFTLGSIRATLIKNCYSIKHLFLFFHLILQSFQNHSAVLVFCSLHPHFPRSPTSSFLLTFCLWYSSPPPVSSWLRWQKLFCPYCRLPSLCLRPDPFRCWQTFDGPGDSSVSIFVAASVVPRFSSFCLFPKSPDIGMNFLSTSLSISSHDLTLDHPDLILMFVLLRIFSI